MRYCQSCHRCFSDAVSFCLMDQTPTTEVPHLRQIIEGKYRLEQLIAHGGMGSVYRATHLQLERPVAIKILRPEFFTDERIVARFHREALAAARLRHPNIVAIYDFGMIGKSEMPVPDERYRFSAEDDVLELDSSDLPQATVPASFSAFIVMELIEGRSLREEMRTNAARNGQISYERAVALIRQVCAGIAAAHQHGVIHRDLKPDNIMIEMQPGDVPGGFAEIIKVLDFGIARLMDTGQSLQSLTEEGTFIGTPSYISPEQCTEQPIDARSDVYSVGVILYEMLTGRVPFTASDASAILLKKLHEQPVAPGRFRADINPALERVIMNALARNPQQRPASALELSRELSEALQHTTTFSDVTPVTMERITPASARAAAVIQSYPDTPALQSHAVPANEEEVIFVRPDEEFVNAGYRELREPEFLPQSLRDSTSRRLWVPMAAMLLALIGGVFIWHRFFAAPEVAGNSLAATVQPKGSSGESSSAAGSLKAPLTSAETPAESRPVSPAPAATASPSQAVPASITDAPDKTSPEPIPTATGEITATTKSEWKQELGRLFYAWATSATRGNWQQHAKFYADNVQYFREGSLSQSSVIARKQRVFGPTGSYQLQFSEMPLVTFHKTGNQTEAEIVFDRQWRINKEQKVTEGKASTALRLRREAQGWRIISERQVRTYFNHTKKASGR